MEMRFCRLKINDKYSGVVKSFLLGLIAATLVFGYFIVRNGGVFTIIDDFNLQQLTFAQAAWNVIHEGGQWSWNLDLGTSLVGGYSFYNLGSPFFWIFLLCPKGSFPYVAGIIYILKYALATLNAYLYLSCFKSNNTENKADYALIGAMLYAFSGFQTVNLLFFHFHDVVAFFPLLLWGIENVDKKNKRPLFIASIFINCLVNYFFFVQEVVFMILYFIVRYWGQSIKEVMNKMLICVLCGIIGVGMASFLFIPSVMYITGNTRSSANLMLQNIAFDSRNILNIIKGLFLPGDSMRGNSIVELRNYNSTSCYLPFVGLSCVIGFIRKDRSWLQRLIVILLIVSFVPFLQAGFLLFTAVYQRWWYMFSLVLALATIKVLEQPQEYNMYQGIRIYILILTAFYLIINYMPWDDANTSIIFYKDRFAYFYVLAVAGPVILDLIHRLNKKNYELEVLFVTLFCIATTGLTLHYYKCEANSAEYMQDYKLAMSLKPIDEQYRYLSVNNVYMLPGEVSGVGAFSSCIENSAQELLDLCEVGTICSSRERLEIPGLGQLFGGKYSITEDEDATGIIDSITIGDSTTYITESEAFPIGYAIDKYLYLNEVYNLPQEARGIALMNAMAIAPSDANKLNASHLDVNTIDFEKTISELANIANTNSVHDFTRDAHGFKCTTDYAKERTIFFSVPNDKGWKATIDGQDTEIINACGMMLINVPEGHHDIEFSFYTEGLKVGIIISMISWIIFIIIFIYEINVERKMRKN